MRTLGELPTSRESCVLTVCTVSAVHAAFLTVLWSTSPSRSTTQIPSQLALLDSQRPSSSSGVLAVSPAERMPARLACSLALASDLLAKLRAVLSVDFLTGLSRESARRVSSSSSIQGLIESIVVGELGFVD